MSSFINLMVNDVWSDADITNRTEAMVRQHISVVEETILNRDITGTAFGVPLSEERMAQVMHLKDILEEARQMGINARSDMALLNRVFVLEAAQIRLARDPIADDSQDIQERAEAQTTLDGVTETELNLLSQRAASVQPPED
jgi:hypothetical protein